MDVRRRRGFALSTTFIVVFLVVLAGFTMASIASFNYQMAKDAQLSDEALETAQAGMALAMNVFMQNPAWGTSPGDVLPESSPNPQGGPPSSDPLRYEVVFQDGVSGLPRSVNNLKGMSRALGPPDPANQNLPRAVPPHSALLFVRGTAGQGSQARRRVLECLVEFPPSTYALTAANAIVSWQSPPPGSPATTSGYNAGNDPAFAVTVDGQTGMASGNGAETANIFAAGTWLGDGSGVNYSVFLSPYSTVAGNVVCKDKNTNVVATPSPVAGMTPEAIGIQAADTTTQIPNVDITSFNNSAQSGSLTWVTDPKSGRSMPVVSGNVYLSTSMAVSGANVTVQNTPEGPRLVLGQGPDEVNGPGTTPVPLCLSNGTLYVDGDLEIPGGIVGLPDPSKATGYADATGSIYVNGQSWICARLYDPQLYSGSGEGIAVFSQKDLNLYPVGWAGTGHASTSGTASGVPTIAGTVYSHGNLNVSQGVHVYGAMVAAGTPGTAGEGDIFMATGAHITYIPSFAQFGNLSTSSTSGGSQTEMDVMYCREVLPR